MAWNCTKAPFSPICQVAKDATATARLPLSQEGHSRLLQRIAAEGKSQLISPNPDVKGADGVPVANAPTLLLAPIRRAEKTELVEFILPPTNSSELNQQALEFLDSSRKIAASFDETVRPEDRPLRLSAEVIDEFALSVHQSLDYRKTASTIANETLSLIHI